MEPKVLVDYELAVAREGYIVRALLKLEGKVPAADRSMPLNLSLVLDRSGSMGGAKLERAKEAAAFLARRVRPDDLLSVVAYDDSVNTVSLPVRGAAGADLPQLIDGIHPGGSTNLSGGWLRGHELTEKGRDGAASGTMHRVLLLTDGLANVGITDAPRLVSLCRAAAAKGVSTSTIGFGEDYDEALLAAMAEAGGGNTYYIERPDQAPGVFEEEIEGLLTLSAQNVVVEVKCAEAVELVAVHNRYPSSQQEGMVRVEMGDLYAREPRALLLEFFVPGLTQGDVQVAMVTISATVLTDDGGVEQRDVRMPIASSLDAQGKLVPEVRTEMLVQEAARAREEALKLRDEGDSRGASMVLEYAASSMVHASVDDESVREQMGDLQMLASKLQEGLFSPADAKYSAQRAYNARRGKKLYEEKLRRPKSR